MSISEIEDYRLPQGWELVKLEMLCDAIADVDHRMPKAQSEGIPYVSPKDFFNGGIDFDNAKKISDADFQQLCK